MAGKRLTKAQVIAELSTLTEMDKKVTTKVLDCLNDLATRELKGADAPGEFVIPGLVKLKLVMKKATEERQGTNPHTRQPMTIPAKPATRSVRASALKALKDGVQ